MKAKKYNQGGSEKELPRISKDTRATPTRRIASNLSKKPKFKMTKEQQKKIQNFLFKEAANKENDKRRGVKPSGFPAYANSVAESLGFKSGGKMVKDVMSYGAGGKMTAGLKALFAEAPELKEKFGYAKYGMKVKKS